MNVPQRRPRADAEDDHVLPFQVDALDVRGRVVRLGPALNEVLAHHDYPAPVARLVAEATTVAVLLGASLKQMGRFIFQTQTDGPVDMLIVDITAPDRVRAYARFDAARVAEAVANNEASSGALLGKGHLAMTIEAGADATRYQGVVALSGEGLEAAAHRYFAQSEQIPSKLRLAVGEEVQTGGRAPKWRAGGLLVQFLPPEAARAARADLDPGDAPAGTQRHEVTEDDAWVEAQALVGDRRGSRTARSVAVERAAALSAVQPAGRARVSLAAGDRAMHLLARAGGEAVARVHARGPRRHGRERQGHREVRILRAGV